VKPRVLVVEDNPANLELAVVLLRAGGFEVATARDGPAGLAEAARNPPDLVLLDLQMPGMDGFEVLRRLRQDGRAARVPVVAVTALAMVGDREAILAAGFDGYVAKPLEPERFSEEVRAFLQEGRR
jgi:two-component system cell cycle response regulator